MQSFVARTPAPSLRDQIPLPRHSVLQIRTSALKGGSREQMLDEASPLGPQVRRGSTVGAALPAGHPQGSSKVLMPHPSAASLASLTLSLGNPWQSLEPSDQRTHSWMESVCEKVDARLVGRRKA